MGPETLMITPSVKVLLGLIKKDEQDRLTFVHSAEWFGIGVQRINNIWEP